MGWCGDIISRKERVDTVLLEFFGRLTLCLCTCIILDGGFYLPAIPVMYHVFEFRLVVFFGHLYSLIRYRKSLKLLDTHGLDAEGVFDGIWMGFFLPQNMKCKTYPTHFPTRKGPLNSCKWIKYIDVATSKNYGGLFDSVFCACHLSFIQPLKKGQFKNIPPENPVKKSPIYPTLKLP